MRSVPLDNFRQRSEGITSVRRDLCFWLVAGFIFVYEYDRVRLVFYIGCSFDDSGSCLSSRARWLLPILAIYGPHNCALPHTLCGFDNVGHKTAWWTEKANRIIGSFGDEAVCPAQLVGKKSWCPAAANLCRIAVVVAVPGHKVASERYLTKLGRVARSVLTCYEKCRWYAFAL